MLCKHPLEVVSWEVNIFTRRLLHPSVLGHCVRLAVGEMSDGVAVSVVADDGEMMKKNHSFAIASPVVVLLLGAQYG